MRFVAITTGALLLTATLACGGSGTSATTPSSVSDLAALALLGGWQGALTPTDNSSTTTLTSTFTQQGIGLRGLVLRVEARGAACSLTSPTPHVISLDRPTVAFDVVSGDGAVTLFVRATINTAANAISGSFRWSGGPCDGKTGNFSFTRS